MDFPITALLDQQHSYDWLVEHLHVQGFACPRCAAAVEHARHFRSTKRSCLPVYRCRRCDKTYNLYTGTLFEQHHLTAQQVVLLIRGVLKGEPSAPLARELAVSRGVVHELRQEIQLNARLLQPTAPLPDLDTESDEMYQNAGEKGDEHFDPADPPRRRANKKRGHGTYANDRPPVIGTVGRQSGQARLRVSKNTTNHSCIGHVQRFTEKLANCYTDELKGYQGMDRQHATVCHSQREWARDDDGDGVREVHTNTIEGLWTTVRNFLRPFRGVHKRYLGGYVAICEFGINHKQVSPALVCALTSLHTLHT